ncbi:class I adenylate-forming enzyme family protein [Sporichthya brevicatena]|uniref:class I adenylate-forming enzyme family protein n=1 Tax=Sporichthya brevicatena TaxID=171442 RepID=UPI0031E454F0
MLAAAAAAHPDREFVVGDDGRASYGEVAARAATLAARLRARGVEPGDRVGLKLPNGVRWVVGLLATHAAGATALPLNTWYKQYELDAVLRRATPTVVLTEEDDFSATAHESAGACQALRHAPTGETDIALLLFTSGSSAEPKAVPLTQAGMILTARAIGDRQGVREADRIWFALPLFFVFGCSNALPNALVHGATLCLQERFEPGAALEFIERERCTVYYGVAPITRALAAHPDLAARDISALRTGTANATPEDLRIAIEVLGISEVCNAYGMTEGHGHSTITDHRDPPEIRMTTQGTALPTQEVRVVANDGGPVEHGTTGHLQIRGIITPGYLDAPDRTAAELNAEAFDADGWFRTGDLAWLDENDRLHFVGRSYELIKAKGINISPAEVESLLVGHQEVEEAFVFGVDTTTGDQEVGAVIVSATDDPERLTQDVIAWARERVSSYKVPRHVWILTADQLPLTPTGKVSKRLLRDQVLSSNATGEARATRPYPGR